MKCHLNKLKKCEKINIDSIKYTDNEIFELSMIKVCKRDKFKCEKCNGRYVNKSFLKIHMEKYCKFKNDNINNKDISNINIDTQNNINMQNIDITNNIQNLNITNIININLPVSFDKEWNLEHFDNFLKMQALVCKNKFTGFLNSVLKNKINLNVVLDKNMKEARIFNGDKYENIAIEELSEKSMEKIYNQLNKLKEDFKSDDSFEISFDEDIKMIKKKYDDYKKNSEIKKKVEEHIASIYDMKKVEAYEIYKEFNNKIEDSYTDY
jgi:ribosomal protein L37AE/L43A